MNILLVDDEPEAIQALRAALGQTNSHEIRTATGREAAQSAQAFERLDLLITNVVMESVDGFTLTKTLQERFPALKTIFTTEYDLSDYAEHTAGHDVLPKPIDSAALLASVTKQIPPPALESTETAESAETAQSPESAQAPETPETAQAAEGPETAPDEPLAEGIVIGAFKIIRPLGDGKWGKIYRAARTQSNRPVTLEFLSAKWRSDPASKAKFIAEITAKTRFRNPSVLSVYGVEEHGETVFSVAEYVEGRSVATLVAAGESIPESMAVETIRVVADALARLNQSRTLHSGLGAGDIWMGADKKPRLSNLITTEGYPPTVQQEMRTLSTIIRSALPGGNATSPQFATLLERMSEGGHGGFPSWLVLLQTLDPSFKRTGAPPSPAPAKQPATPSAPEQEEPARPWRRWLFAIVLGVAGIVSLGYLGRLAASHLFKPKDFEAMVEIPGGNFIYQDNLRLNVPTFWIDKYEVTIGQYAQFLEVLDKTPTTEYDSPLQPKAKISHKPKSWDLYYKAATTTHLAGFVPIDLNCPIFLVDWYDAYAYAKWKGRRLPTEVEWEKAGRGPDGSLYPWGNTMDPKKCNSSADYDDNPKAGGNVDGYNRWCPVNAIMADRSIYGVIGLAGNVAEWTDSWDQAAKIPVVRGGSYHSPDNLLTRRVFLEPYGSSEYVGFRTASSDPPKK